jgi:aspartate ammonia-lyase
MKKTHRIEHDFLGERTISNDFYYGIQTLRAVENFQITGIPISAAPLLIKSFAYVKKAAALANRDLEVLEPHIAEAICAACDRIAAGELSDQFVVDIIQGGAGTSTNMNVNEVVANLALEILGHEKGQYDIIHPNNHVNCSQSTNDTYPTAFRMALYQYLDELLEAMNALKTSFEKKGEEFAEVLKMGRTQLQDAVPMTQGDEFVAYAVNLGEEEKRIQEVQQLILEINLGGTAIGTAINAPEGYPELATRYLAEVSGIPVILSPNLIEATWDTGAYVQVSSVLKRFALKLSKICNDLRLLSSGPRAGLNEINLPQLQPGSSIMPGKVNPVIPEVVNQIAFLVLGHDLTVSFASEAGQLQLNVMEPVMAYALFRSIRMLIRGCLTLKEKCIDGITVNVEVSKNHVMNSIGIVTALNPILGYETSASIAKEAHRTGATIREIVLKRNLLDEARLDEIFSIENLKRPRFIQ